MNATRSTTTTARLEDLPERFRDKIVVDHMGCWIWCAYCTPAGYGMTTIGSTNVGAHRATYELLVGPIPEGLHLDHLCMVTNCVNPDHLDPVTPRENLRRGHRSTRVMDYEYAAEMLRTDHSVFDVAQQFRVSPQSVRRAIERGALPLPTTSRRKAARA